jgi:hypothetical protein
LRKQRRHARAFLTNGRASPQIRSRTPYARRLAGETIISNEMTKKVGEMIKIFIERAKERLEK